MKLILKFKETVLNEFIIGKDSITVGRDPQNDIVIDNRAVSRYHTKIYQRDDVYLVEDLKSGNGTFLNHKKISKAVLRHRDTIDIGKHTLVFLSQEKTMVIELPKPEDTLVGEETYILAPHLASEFGSAGGPPEGSVDILSGNTPQASVKLTKQTTIAGKSPMADIKLRGFLVGDVAFRIQKTSESFVISHAEGRRATRVNDQAIHDSQELKNGDLITVGGTKLQFHLKTH